MLFRRLLYSDLFSRSLFYFVKLFSLFFLVCCKFGFSFFLCNFLILLNKFKNLWNGRTLSFSLFLDTFSLFISCLTGFHFEFTYKCFYLLFYFHSFPLRKLKFKLKQNSTHIKLHNYFDFIASPFIPMPMQQTLQKLKIASHSHSKLNFFIFYFMWIQ